MFPVHPGQYGWRFLGPHRVPHVRTLPALLLLTTVTVATCLTAENLVGGVGGLVRLSPFRHHSCTRSYRYSILAPSNHDP